MAYKNILDICEMFHIRNQEILYHVSPCTG